MDQERVEEAEWKELRRMFRYAVQTCHPAHRVTSGIISPRNPSCQTRPRTTGFPTTHSRGIPATLPPGAHAPRVSLER